jgi:hypothetical protein
MNGWRPLERSRHYRSLRHTPGVYKSQCPQQAEWRNNPRKEKRQNRSEIRIAGMAVWNQHQQQRKADRDCRNQQKPAPPSVRPAPASHAEKHTILASTQASIANSR